MEEAIRNATNNQNLVDWVMDGNVIEVKKGVYATQDAMYRNRLIGVKNLVAYYNREFE